MEMTPLLISLLAATVAAFLPASARAELRFEQTSAQLSATADDRTLSTRFPFKNIGATPVFVASITTSCTCTTAHLEKMHVAPGEEGAVLVTYKIGADEGPQSQTVTLVTNENNGTPYILTLKADIPPRPRTGLPRVIPVSATLLFWSKKPFQTKTVKVDLRGLTDAKISVTCSHAVFKISHATSSDKTEVLISVIPVDTADDARGQLLITVETKTEKIVSQPVSLTLLAK